MAKSIDNKELAIQVVWQPTVTQALQRGKRKDFIRLGDETLDNG